MPDEAHDAGQPPAWWMVDRRAARDAERQARRQARAERAQGRSGRGDARHARRSGEAQRSAMTPEQIADAAIAVIDEGGVDALTVRALAERLGVGTMTLYWYVQNKDEVLDLVADRLLAGVELPVPSDAWRESMLETALTVRAALLRHARALPVLVSRGSFGPNGLRLIESSLAALKAAGFGAEEAADAYFSVGNFITGWCIFESQLGISGGLGADTTDRSAYLERARRYLALLPPADYPNLLAAVPRMFGGNIEDRFRYGLDCLLDGLAARARPGA